jgi:galactarate dehydratase
MTIEEAGWELFQLILDVASGRKQVWADKWGCTTIWYCSTPRR